MVRIRQPFLRTNLVTSKTDTKYRQLSGLPGIFLQQRGDQSDPIIIRAR
ncbi:MAG: hypothetical protein ACXV5F_07995 [Halobacteriota archaeon]